MALPLLQPFRGSMSPPTAQETRAGADPKYGVCNLCGSYRDHISGESSPHVRVEQNLAQNEGGNCRDFHSGLMNNN